MLPMPPNEDEKYWYMGKQHRWLLVLQSCTLALVIFSIGRFAWSRPPLWCFFVPAMVYILAMAVSLASGMRRKRTSRMDHELRTMSYEPEEYPTVDVFLPTAGEPLEVLENTYRFVSRLDWPAAVTVWVFDDADREEVRGLAESRSFEYRVRPNRGHLKKAGNLRFGYEQSSSEFIVVFDADFAPRHDFLRELMPYFLDESTGIVQSPQFFDSRKGMSWLQRCAGATQELFYRWIQPARDRSRAAICVGTCAIYRRTALERAGGFAQIGHSEDVHTGVKVAKAGFQLRYVPILLAKGLCPDTLLAFVNQQYRWCTGSMSLLADASFHRHPAFSWRQRCCYWSGFLYYITTAVNVFLAPLPGLLMLWLFADDIHPRNTVWLLGAIMLWYFVLPTVMRGHWRMDVLRVQQLYSFAHAIAIVHFLSGRTREWVATGSVATRSTPLAVTIARVMRITAVVTQVLLWTGLVLATLSYGIHETWAMLGFGLLAAYVQIPMLLLPNRGRRRRRRATVVDQS